MKYKLFENFNDSPYLNESEGALVSFMKKMKTPIPKNIPKDGTWSEEIMYEGNYDYGIPLFDTILEKDLYWVKATINENAGPGEVAAKFSSKYRLEFFDNPPEIGDWKTLALIDGRWYYYDE
jgi:hypothetical protein